MAAKYILAAGAALFILAALARLICTGQLAGSARTWLTMGLIFAAVSGWLFAST